MPRWQVLAARVAHGVLYALLLIIPLTGWLYSSASGVQVVYLGLVPLPDLVPQDKGLAAVFRASHVRLNFTLLALVCIHVAAALRHYFVDGDRRADSHAARGPNENPPLRLPIMVLLRSFIPTLGMLLLAAGQARAQGVLIDRSEIRFVSKQMGVNVEGRFRKWKANIVFLPKDPGASKADFEIDLGSIDLASDEAETEIKRSVWFDTANFPVAKFVSSEVRNTGTDKYEVAGALTIKGITRDAVVPVTMKKGCRRQQRG